MACTVSFKACSFRFITGKRKFNIDWNLLTDKTLKAFAQLWLVIAITCQWVLGYYAADYYSHMNAGINRISVNRSLIFPYSIKSKIINIIYR